MAVYKVIQDIEAEDKLFGPLSLKSFVYAAISTVLIFINVRLLIANGPLIIRLILVLVLIFPAILFGVLASPLGRQQPTEVWLLAHIKFFLKPRVRVWDQSGLKQLVTVTVPKQLERQLTKGFTQVEVRSRLQALASTLDSRGWAIKNLDINTDAMPGYLDGSQGDSDRLVGTSSLPQQVATVDVHASDDILDETSNTTAQNFASLVKEAEIKRKKEVADKVEAVRLGEDVPPASTDSTFLDKPVAVASQPTTTTFVGRAVVNPGRGTDIIQASNAPITNAEKKLLERRHKEFAEIESKMPKNFGHRVERWGAHSPPTGSSKGRPGTATAGVTALSQAAKLELAQSGNDLSVASIEKLANRKEQVSQAGPNELVLNLH